MNVMTIGGMSRPCCGDGMITVSLEEGSSAKISVLVVRGKLLGFDLLLGINAIKALGGMVVGPPPKELIPLMAVLQQHKSKVRPTAQLSC